MFAPILPKRTPDRFVVCLHHQRRVFLVTILQRLDDVAVLDHAERVVPGRNLAELEVEIVMKVDDSVDQFIKLVTARRAVYGPMKPGVELQESRIVIDCLFDLGVQFAAINRKFENFTSNRHREMFGYRAKESGLGDIRVFGKVNLAHEPVVGTLMLGIKAPTGDFRAAPEAMSAGNGQWDVEVVAQIGKSFYPIPAYANIDLGYRLRETNETIHHNPDDELIYNVEVGASPVEMLNVALKLEGISGAGRRVTYAIPTAIVSLPQGLALEAAARVSVLGRADPALGAPYTFFAGSTFLFGISYTGSLME